MDKINIVYIDDRHDEILSRYLGEDYTNANFEIEHEDILFNPNEGYESLMRNPSVMHANIIIIDSRLFENSATISKFTGEEFKLILKKYYPFVEVIVITQNDADAKVGTISKYNPNSDVDGPEYYANKLPPYLNTAINNILTFRELASRLESNESWEPILKEKIIESLQGINTYDALTKKDIDDLISAFKEIQVKLDG